MRGMHVRITRVETELGVEKCCTKCGELWPEDDEFYYFHMSTGTYYTECRACYSDRRVKDRQKQKQNLTGVRA